MTPSEKACIEIVLLISERIYPISKSTNDEALNQLIELVLKVTSIASQGAFPDQAERISARFAAGMSLFDQAVVAERNHDEQAMRKLAANARELAERSLRGEI